MGMMSWLLKRISDYIRLGIFAAGILIGVQAPAFVDQYEKRVDAHLIEAKEILNGFQNTANRYFEGDIQRLITHYRNSQDKVFEDDANNIEFIVNRVETLKKQQQALSTNFLNQVRYLTLSADKELAFETFDNYSYVVPLNSQALISGAVIAVIFLLISDFFAFLTKRSVRRLKSNKTPQDLHSKH